jgi:hypothetical protein
VLSFDVEEHFQVSAFSSDARRQQRFHRYLNLKRTEQRRPYLLRDVAFAPVVETGRPIREMVQARAQFGTAVCAVSG